MGPLAVISISSPNQRRQFLASVRTVSRIRWVTMKTIAIHAEQDLGPAVFIASVRSGLAAPPERRSEALRTLPGNGLRMELAERRQEVVDASVAVGGLLRAEAFSTLMRVKYDQPVSMLARWIVDRRVLTVNWCAQIMLPLFQFQRPGLDPMPAMREVRDEFEGTFDDWETLEWFVTPNAALQYESPARRVPRDPCAVLQAARVDRFIARGL